MSRLASVRAKLLSKLGTMVLLSFALLAGFGSARSEAKAKAELPKKFSKSPYSLMSLSVGAPNNGYQLRAKRLRETASLKVKSSSRRRVYGHPALVLMLKRSARDIAKAAPNSVMLVGDLSREAGGALSGHRSHQSGRDADIGFYVRNSEGTQVKLDAFVKINSDGRVRGHKGLYFDDHRNWLLVRSWLRDKRAGISHVFVAGHVRNRLLAYARSKKAERGHYQAAAGLLKQPSNSSLHDDHFHLRIDCPRRQREICIGEAISD